ncbi:MAG: sensor histidine kinase [bacterium]
MRTFRGKLIFLMIVSALTPLMIYGALSLYNSQRTLRRTIQDSYGEIARRTAGEIRLYLSHAQSLLATLVVDLANTNLNPEQIQRILENYVIRFPEFDQILLFGKDGALSFSTRSQEESPDMPPQELVKQALGGQETFSEAYLSEDLTPVIWFLLPMKSESGVSGALAAQIDLMRMWEWVAATRLGKEGYVSVVDQSGKLVASGDPYYKRAILSSEQPVYFDSFRKEELSDLPSVRETSRGKRLVSFRRISEAPPWYIVISQPVREAFASLRAMTWVLVALILGSLALMLAAAFVASRRLLLRPVQQLMLATEALGRGDLDYRLPPLGEDELGRLGASFNKMSEDLGALQEVARRQERMAMFGRIASGLAHDLKHPVKNIENAAKVMETMYEDANYRETFTRIVKREFSRINQFLEDLRNLTHEMPYHPILFDLGKVLAEVVESFQLEAKNKGAKIILSLQEGTGTVVGDMFLLRRVFENLVSNALQALGKPEGLVEIGLQEEGDLVVATVRDNGPGIPAEKLPGLFEEFVTTKRKGLGLGLAITKKILALHQGSISVESEVGTGTTFFLRWPLKAG